MHTHSILTTISTPLLSSSSHPHLVHFTVSTGSNLFHQLKVPLWILPGYIREDTISADCHTREMEGKREERRGERLENETWWQNNHNQTCWLSSEDIFPLVTESSERLLQREATKASHQTRDPSRVQERERWRRREREESKSSRRRGEKMTERERWGIHVILRLNILYTVSCINGWRGLSL